MNREEQRLPPASAKSSECLIDRVMIWPVKDLGARLLLFRLECDVTGYDDAVADLENRLRVARLTVEIDDQPRVRGKHRRRVQSLGQPLREFRRADIPRNMLGERDLIQPERSERPRHRSASMIANQQDRPRRLRLYQDVGRGFIGTDQHRRRLRKRRAALYGRARYHRLAMIS